jgi:hypothetical protein
MRAVITPRGAWKRLAGIVRALATWPDSELAEGIWPSTSFMLPHERELLGVRMHPGMLTVPSAFLLGTLTMASLITAGVVPGGAAVAAIGWVACLVALLGVLAAAAVWSSSFFTVTDLRMIAVRGRRAKKVLTMPLAEARDLRFERTLLGRIIGYGTFVIILPGPGRGRQKVTYLPYPEQLYLEVCGLLYPDSGRG